MMALSYHASPQKEMGHRLNSLKNAQPTVEFSRNRWLSAPNILSNSGLQAENIAIKTILQRKPAPPVCSKADRGSGFLRM